MLHKKGLLRDGSSKEMCVTASPSIGTVLQFLQFQIFNPVSDLRSPEKCDPGRSRGVGVVNRNSRWSDEFRDVGTDSSGCGSGSCGGTSRGGSRGGASRGVPRAGAYSRDVLSAAAVLARLF